MSALVQAHDLQFKLYISAARIQERIQELGQQIRDKYAGERPVFIGVLNGCFIFTADLVRAANIDCEVSFVKLASYVGTRSSGEIKSLIGLEIDLSGRPVIIVEDIVDTGRTLHNFRRDLLAMNPKSVEIASLLLKPDALAFDLPVNYTGFEIPSKFVIGYGLDYDGVGRQFDSIYQLANENE